MVWLGLRAQMARKEEKAGTCKFFRVSRAQGLGFGGLGLGGLGFRVSV